MKRSGKASSASPPRLACVGRTAAGWSGRHSVTTRSADERGPPGRTDGRPLAVTNVSLCHLSRDLLTMRYDD